MARTAAARVNLDGDSLYTTLPGDADADAPPDGGGDYRSADAGGGAPDSAGDASGDAPAPRPRRTRKPRAAQPEPAAPPVHSRAQIRGVAKSISLSADFAFRGVATIRAMQWGVIPVNTPDGMQLIPAGQHWLLDPKEAQQLGEAWAEVVALYAPPELVERGAVLSTALFSTGSILASRLLVDAQMAAQLKAMRLRQEEGIGEMPPNIAAYPNSAPPPPPADGAH